MRRFLWVVTAALSCGGDGIDDRLQQVAGLTVQERFPAPDGYRQFELTFDQPEEHDRPQGKRFAQRLVLLHRGDDAPVVVHATGYFLFFSSYLSEPAFELGANHISVEHRFFGDSRAEPPDWSALTIRQAADDIHRIIGAFKSVYPGSRFITVGESKGGMTMVYHRRFYPDDVDGTVAYVAPISFGAPDERYVAFVQSAGNAPCRQKLAALQRIVLGRRPAMIERMTGSDLTYTILGADKALEHFVLEFPFSFWQYQLPSACDLIADATIADDDLFIYLNSAIANVNLGDGSDAEIERFAGYYYQSATQLGFPRIDETNVADLLLYPGTDVAAAYVPDLATVYDGGAAMNDIDQWVRTEGSRLMFVYGDQDPWFAGAFELGAATDSYRLVVPGGNHSSKIQDLPSADREQALDALHRWAGVGSAAAVRVPKARRAETETRWLQP